MASPHASSFICLPFVDHPDVVLAYTVYFSVCIGSALIGVAGALLFLSQVMRSATESTYQSSSATSQRRILILLAVSDLFADIGVIARSVYWLAYWRRLHLNQEANFADHLAPAIGGAVVESWVFFWYLATYFWTFFFAVDMYNSKHGGRWKLFCSHYFTWTFCTIYVAGSVASLWACQPYLECTHDKYCVIGHFMCTFGPIVIFMTALPLFYSSTWRQMKKAASTGPVVDIWKKEREMSRRKILSIILVFYLCWFINVIDGTILIVAHALFKGPNEPPPNFYVHIFDNKYIYAIWLLEAILNPLQGFFNAIAYGGICQIFCTWLCTKLKRKDPYVSSWSGEYIDVDFRVSRGRIHCSRRKIST